MTVSLTMFKSKYDNKTHKNMSFDTFAEFEKLLYNLTSVEYTKKEDAPLISPATYQPESLRRNVNVIDWGGWAAIDVDDWTPGGDLKEAIIDKFSKYYFVAYSTAGSTVAVPKFRVVFPLTDRLPADRIAAFWYALNVESGSVGDKQVKDLSRMYYVPADYHTSDSNFNFIFTHSDGQFISPDDLIRKYEMPVKKSMNFFDNLPGDMQAQIIQHRKDNLDNTDFHWTSYRDCPFFPKRMAIEYQQISSTGWYAKMYQIMVAIGGNAVNKGYPITPVQIAELCKELDNETGGWYANRPIEREADRALEYVYHNM